MLSLMRSQCSPQLLPRDLNIEEEEEEEEEEDDDDDDDDDDDYDDDDKNKEDLLTKLPQNVLDSMSLCTEK